MVWDMVIGQVKLMAQESGRRLTVCCAGCPTLIYSLVQAKYFISRNQ